jgi:periplasmic protein TonB
LKTRFSHKEAIMFDPILSESTARTRRPLAVTLSFGGQVLVVGLAVLVPILRPEGILLVRMSHVIPAPVGIIREREPQKPKSAARATLVRTTLHALVEPVFRQPARVPASILVDESEPPAALPPGLTGPVIPGGTGGVPWGTGSSTSLVPKLPPPKPARPAAPAPPPRVTVGGFVQAAKIVHQVMPIYPPQARQARISGTVRLEAVISRGGIIQSLRVMSGHPWLAQAALDAVRQWVYRPTRLNGEPVEVLTQIEVNFKFGE